MPKEKKKIWLVIVPVLFILYVLLAVEPVPPETILIPRWLSSLESNYPVVPEDPGEGTELLPFTLGDRFGYVDETGRFILNRTRKGNLSLSPEYWAEYGAIPQSLEVRTPRGETSLSLEKAGGYPFFMDGRIFLLGSDLSSVSALDGQGAVLWTYDFAAPLTAADAAAGYFLAGSVDGRVELLDSRGALVFPPFEPGGSRLPGIMGCALSRDGSRIAVVSGIDKQRFLLLERSGESYRVLYHEFLGEGFRRPVHIAFIDQDSRVAFEREEGLGIYGISSRTGVKLPLEGRILGFDGGGEGNLFFVITAPSEEEKRLVAVRLPGTVIMEAPFKSAAAFLGRRGSRIYVGGGTTLASFELGKK